MEQPDLILLTKFKRATKQVIRSALGIKLLDDRHIQVEGCAVEVGPGKFGDGKLTVDFTIIKRDDVPFDESLLTDDDD